MSNEQPSGSTGDLRSRLRGVLDDAQFLVTQNRLDSLVDDLIATLVPEHHILVSFEAVTSRESGDWELSQPGYDVTDLGHPQIIAHRLSDDELARLYFQIESLGTLGESNA